ncbi:hypothetical protein VTL71DRAFT_14897 [Oculimacula yallundae]|uniref:Uncharacterized protein n=1 Tax=Oculimacula yallundae TaxID=86028 RepID=A0ABR4CFM4_9HELO
MPPHQANGGEHSGQSDGAYVAEEEEEEEEDKEGELMEAEPEMKSKKKNRVRTKKANSTDVSISIFDNSNIMQLVVMSEAEILRSAVCKYLKRVEKTEDVEDSDDDICYDQTTTKNRHKGNYRYNNLIRCLEAVSEEFDKHYTLWDEFDVKIAKDLKFPLKSSVDKIWKLVQVWYSWTTTDKLTLGRDAFQRERMVRFCRVMELPKLLQQAVFKHKVDEVVDEDKKIHEMSKAGFHPEQQADKNDK